MRCMCLCVSPGRSPQVLHHLFLGVDLIYLYEDEVEPTYHRCSCVIVCGCGFCVCCGCMCAVSAPASHPHVPSFRTHSSLYVGVRVLLVFPMSAISARTRCVC